MGTINEYRLDQEWNLVEICITGTLKWSGVCLLQVSILCIAVFLLTLGSLLTDIRFLSLASTFILTRISVVHHAALNCIRRVFAIIVTSFLFRVPITFTGICGIFISIVGFLSFTHYKTKRLRQPKPVSSLLPLSEHNREPER